MPGSMRTAGPPTEPSPYPQQQPSAESQPYPGQEAYAQQQWFAEQPPYAPQPPYSPQPSYAPQASYAPAPTVAQHGYAPQQGYAEQDPPTVMSPMAPAPAPAAPQEQLRDAFGRLVVVDLSGRAPGLHAPAQAPVRVFGSTTAARPSVERWGDQVIDLGAPQLRRERRPRARGRTALVAACVAATLAVGAVVVVAMRNQPGVFKVDIGEQQTTEPSVISDASTAEQPGPSVAVPSMLGGPSVIVAPPADPAPGAATTTAKGATAKTSTTKASPAASTAKPSVKPTVSPTAAPTTATPTPTPTAPSPDPTTTTPDPTTTKPSPVPTITVPDPTPVKTLPTATVAPAVGAGG